MVRYARSETALKDPLMRPLHEDLIECEDLLDKASAQNASFARRTFFRCSFAYFEGNLYWLKGVVATWVAKKNPVEFPKLVLLLDSTFKPTDTGKLREVPNRLTFYENCTFILRTAAEFWGMDADKFFSEHGWDAMQKSLKIRHRLTHPKQPTDLDVSTAELDLLREAHTWLHNCVIDIANAGVEKVEKMTAPLTDS